MITDLENDARCDSILTTKQRSRDSHRHRLSRSRTKLNIERPLLVTVRQVSVPWRNLNSASVQASTNGSYRLLEIQKVRKFGSLTQPFHGHRVQPWGWQRVDDRLEKRRSLVASCATIMSRHFVDRALKLGNPFFYGQTTAESTTIGARTQRTVSWVMKPAALTHTITTDTVARTVPTTGLRTVPRPLLNRQKSTDCSSSKRTDESDE